MKPEKPYYIGTPRDPEQSQFPYDGETVRMQQFEQENLLRHDLSGPLGQGPYSFDSCGAQSVQDVARELDRQERVRAAKGGLPDGW